MLSQEGDWDKIVVAGEMIGRGERPAGKPGKSTVDVGRWKGKDHVRWTSKKSVDGQSLISVEMQVSHPNEQTATYMNMDENPFQILKIVQENPL